MDDLYPTAGTLSFSMIIDAVSGSQDLMWTNVVADAAIGLSYLSIAVALVTLACRRRDVAFGWMSGIISAFLLLSGATHLLAVWSMWNPGGNVGTAVKLATAIVSFAAAVALWPLVVKARLIPSAEHLRAANSALQAEIAERMRTEAMLHQAQKVDAVGQLTSGVAHDFNNVLTVVSGNVELAARALEAGDTRRVGRHLASAMRGVGQAKTLTGRLLAFSRRQGTDVRPADPNKMIGGMSDLLTRALGEAVEVRATLGQAVGTVEVDRNQFEAALLNLAVNARDAMTVGDIPAGFLTIRTENVTLGAGDALPHDDVVPGEYVAISVGDTGAGMASAVTDRAMEPFYTTKPAGSGAGLGLSQVLTFVKQAGGHLRIESQVDAGTTVHLYLPRVDAVSASARSVEPGILRRGHGEVVLVVEDEANVRDYVVESLRDIGYHVIEASEASEALDCLDAGRHVDVLLTDVVMPRMSGRVLADTARVRHPGLRVLYMTGYAPGTLSASGKPDRRVTMISKPFTLFELAAKLREVLDASAPNAQRTLTTLLGETRW